MEKQKKYSIHLGINNYSSIIAKLTNNMQPES